MLLCLFLVGDQFFKDIPSPHNGTITPPKKECFEKIKEAKTDSLKGVLVSAGTALAFFSVAAVVWIWY